MGRRARRYRQPDMDCKLFTVLLFSGLTVRAEPPVFEEYFDDSIKYVDISFDAAVRSWLTNGESFSNKVSKAYDKCFGTDYDFDELAENGDGKDRDGDGLPDEFNKAEACFYRSMGWDDKTGADTIKADLAGLETGMGAEFGENVDKCAAWSGDFSSARVRREAGQEAEQVPQLFEGGARSLGWLKSLVRKTRSADRDERAKKGNNKGKGEGKSQGKSRGKKAERQTNRQLARKDQKESARKSVNKKPNGPAKNKNRNNSVKAKKGNKNQKIPKKKQPKGDKNKSNKTKTKLGKNNNGRSRSGGKDKASKEDKKEAKKAEKKEKKKAEKQAKSKNQERKGKSGKSDKKKGKDKNKMDESTYNRMWCFDLAVEQVLEKCVEDKIKN